MHGVIFSELRKYVENRHGEDAWKGLLRSAGLGARIYLPIREYPDGEAAALVSAASAATGVPARDILEDFGTFIAPDLLEMYRSLVRPEWRTLDFLEKTEETIHRVVRLNDAAARPPELRCERTAGDEVLVRYASARRMCGVAIGIVRGVAAHYGECVEIVERRCMHRGDPECEIVVRVT
ncbi:MAG TPA: heme NO-binding domain-containing protein [Longimicrobium sp.]|nr:heme NO-binding domain-containing protein [Longimicrobium sp.]